MATATASRTATIPIKKGKKTDKPILGRETFWPLCVKAKKSTDTLELNINTMVELWKILPSSTVERHFVFCHFLLLNQTKSLWNSAELIWIMRNRLEPRGEAHLRRFFQLMFHPMSDYDHFKLFAELFAKVPATTFADAVTNGRMIGKLMEQMRNFCCGTFLVWTQSADKERDLRKLGVIVPRYSDIDRRRIMIAMENRPSLNQVNFLQSLFATVGKENFEYLVFGRLKKCGTCGATNREKFLWCCKACVEDRIRPKQRYCDEECQRADWLKHRKMHPDLEKKREPKAKAQAQRKGKGGKKGKKKRKNKK